MPCTRINPPSCELYVERAPMPPVGRSSSSVVRAGCDNLSDNLNLN